MGQEEFTKCFGFLQCGEIASQELAGSISISLGFLQLAAAGDRPAGKAAVKLHVCKQLLLVAGKPHSLTQMGTDLPDFCTGIGNTGWSFLNVLVGSFVADYCYHMASVKW